MKRLKVVNLEQGRPNIEQARVRLAEELRQARTENATLLKIVHGYGSSGVGGALRDALLGTLGSLKMDGQIRDFVAGEDWRISDETSWHLIQQHGELRRDSDLGRGNRGITIVVL